MPESQLAVRLRQRQGLEGQRALMLLPGGLGTWTAFVDGTRESGAAVEVVNFAAGGLPGRRAELPLPPHQLTAVRFPQLRQPLGVLLSISSTPGATMVQSTTSCTPQL